MRAAEIGIRIGLLPSGPTNSILDVAGTGVGHATVWRDEPDLPRGRGIARTGVTVIDPGGNLYRAPIIAGGAVLNGAGECTGLLEALEWGIIETPIFLTSTMQLGRVFDAACELLIEEDPAIGAAGGDVIIPVVAECDDSYLNDARRMQVTRDDVAGALARARASVGAASPPAEGAVGAGTGMSCLGYKGGIGTASRVVESGHTVGVLAMTNFGIRDRLTIDGVPVGRLLPAPVATPAPDAGSCIVVVLTDAPLDAAACQRLARRAGLGLARTGSTATHGSGEIFLAGATGLRAPRGTTPDTPAMLGEALNPFFAAVVEATEESVLNSMLQAMTVTGRAGNTSVGLPAEAVAELLRAHGR
ncbi:MAG TPA: P1 family peptidase [Micromonosporaceae bacterium]